jgi:hypothetical protein
METRDDARKVWAITLKQIIYWKQYILRLVNHLYELIKRLIKNRKPYGFGSGNQVDGPWSVRRDVIVTQQWWRQCVLIGDVENETVLS